jgi:putative transposase
MDPGEVDDGNDGLGCPMSRWVCETWDGHHDPRCSDVTDIPGAPSYPLNVTKGLQRFYGGQDLHFVTFSCYHRQPLLSDARRDLFLQILERVRRRYRLVVLGYVVMPEHVHLLVSEPQRSTLSTVIQAVKLGLVRSLEGGGSIPTSRKRSEKRGTPAGRRHFWQARFYDFNVWTEKKRIEKLRYIHRNPVARGLVERPEQWKWSSFRWYLSGEPGPVRINDTDILVMTVRPPAA